MIATLQSRTSHFNLNQLFFSLVAAAFLFFPGKTLADEVKAVIDRTRMTPEESAQLSIIVPGGEASVDVSVIKDFKVISQGTSSSIQIINGRVTREARYNYALLPLKEGALVIPAVEVRLDGKTYKTNSIQILVTRSQKEDHGRRPLFAEAALSDENLYVGQQFIYTLRFYTAVRIANAGLQQPDFNGFTSKEIQRKEPFRQIVDGQEYTVTELAYILTPLKSGRIEINPAVLTCDVVKQRPGSRRGFPFDSFFDDPFFSGGAELESRIVKTLPMEINVRSLPPDDGTEKFSGLLGRIDLQVQLDQNKLKMGDSATMTIIISGQGNIMDAQLPEMNIPDGFKLYPDSPQDEVAPGPNGYSGKKTFRVALVAVAPGNYEIAPIRLHYFDPADGKYHTLASSAFGLEVLPDEKQADLKIVGQAQTDQIPKIKKKKVEFSEQDILPLKDGLEAVENQKELSLSWFVMLLLIPGFSAWGALALIRFVGKEKSPSEIMAKRASIALKNARQKGLAEAEGLALLHKALMAAVFARAGLQQEAATYQEVENLLRQTALPGETITQILGLLADIDSARYGGSLGKRTGYELLLDKTKGLIRKILP